ncbi:MAG: hypothetical protein HC888_02525 [Candidatus Competibacteraceae bacterium]|nr:hypothetical protein [Candidatus Competibacteraceae bacterium]
MVLKSAVLGWYGKNNIGDESYKLSFPKLLPNHELTFADTISGEFDHIFLGGGDVVAPLSCAHQRHTLQKHAVSVTVSDEASIDDLRMFDTLAVRDRLTVQKLQVAGLNALYVPDFAFALKPDRENGWKLWKDLFKSEGRDLYQNRVVVTLNAHLMAKMSEPARKHMMFEHLMFELAHANDHFNASFLFLPFGTSMPWDDRIPGGIVQSRCKFWRKNLAVYNRLTVQETLDIYAAATVAVSTRLHSTIFATLGHTPFIDITHNHKNSAFLASTGLQDYGFDYWSFNHAQFNSLLDTLLKGRGEVREKLRVIANAERSSLASFQKDVLDLQQKPRGNSSNRF